MKKLSILTVVIITLFIISGTAYARGRKGSHRVGGYNSHGKGSHYVGGN